MWGSNPVEGLIVGIYEAKSPLVPFWGLETPMGEKMW